MNYRELLEYTKSNPGCFETSRQQQYRYKGKYSKWVDRRNRYFEDSKNASEIVYGASF